MTKNRLQRVLVLGALLGGAMSTWVSCTGPCLGPACGDADSGLPPGTCVPDESFNTATAVALVKDTNTTGSICPINDADYFSFNSGENDLVEVLLDTTADLSPVDLQASVVDSVGTVAGVARDTDGSDGPTHVRLVAKVARNTQYFIQVMDVGSDEADLHTVYTVRYTLAAEPDANEAGPDPTVANLTASGNTGYLATTADVDNFSVTAAPGSIMRFDLSVPEASTALPVAVVSNSDATNATIYTSPTLSAVSADGRKHARVNIALRGTGPYKVMVADPLGGADFRTPEGQYLLVTEVIPDPDLDEGAATTRNDTVATPYKVVRPLSASAHTTALSTVGDADYYMVTLDAADVAPGSRKLMEVRVSMPAGTNIRPDFQPALFVWDDKIRLYSGNQSGRACRQVRAGSGGYICGQNCTGCNSPDTCLPNDPDQPTQDRFCATTRILRQLKAAADGSITASVRYPVRSLRNLTVGLVEQNGDSWDERPITMTFHVFDDPDTHEPDDLPTELLAVRTSTPDEDARRDRDKDNFPHDTFGIGSIPQACPLPVFDADGGAVDSGPPPSGCLPRAYTPQYDRDGGLFGVSDAGVDPNTLTIDCSGFNRSASITGRLSHEGDRDYYKLVTPPGTYGVDVDLQFAPSSSTPVEFSLQMYIDGRPAPNFGSSRGQILFTDTFPPNNPRRVCQYNAQCGGQGNRCVPNPGHGRCINDQSACQSDSDCPRTDGRSTPCQANQPGEGLCMGECTSAAECTNPDAGVSGVCISQYNWGECWEDGDNNPGTNPFSGQHFIMSRDGPSNNDCSFIKQCDEVPMWIEVVDFGLNDSDVDTPYTITVNVSCGCPSGNACDFCPYPVSCEIP